MIKGIARGCEHAGCALIGGETAEMPGMYPQGEYDLAGFCVGVVEKERILDGRSIAPGDALLGLASSGPHSNGYSLIRKILERGKPPFDPLEPTRIYVKPVLKLLESVPVKGLAHITGGGLIGNVPRILPKKRGARESSRRPGRGPRSSSGCSRPATSPRTRCTASSTAASAWWSCVPRDKVQAARTLLEREGETVYEIGAIEKSKGEPEALIV